jgi:DNA mismatch repair protein MutS2
METPGMDAQRELELTTARALEWPTLLDQLSRRALSEPGHSRLLALTPAATPQEARRRTAHVRAVVELAEHGGELPLIAFPDIEATLDRTRIGASASGQELSALQRVLEQARSLRRVAQEHGPALPPLAELLHSEPRLDKLLLRLDESLERDGSVADGASAALAEARSRARELQAELKRRLAELVLRHAEVLSGQYATERDGRYVLPVRADAHYRVEGIVLGSSGSGGTLYVEPRELTDLGNRLRVREAAIEREVARVLAELSGLVQEQQQAVERAFEVCAQADVVGALARWAVETRSRPVDVADDDSIRVRAARHPLLACSPQSVVPNDLELRGGQALVISGPNAGGKTVTLKCLGLFAWMVRAGIPIPAALESHVGWFDSVLAEIGDDQSLVRSLSTFTAHVHNLARMLEQAGPHVLVLLDEVATGTDPEEGAALASAVLEALAARGAAVAVTTHYERLKELAAGQGRLANAAVGFDFQRLEPTFRLHMGVPGASSALAVASRHGLSPSIIERARELIPQAARERERVVQELAAERERLRAERQALDASRSEQEALASALASEHEQLQQQARSEVEREARELRSQVQLARGDIQRARVALRSSQLDAGELRKLEALVSSAASQIAIGGPLASSALLGRAPAQGVRIDAEKLTPGARVRLRSTGATGTVLEPPSRGEVRLRVGALRLTQKLDEVELLPKGAAERKPRAQTTKPAPATRAEARRTRDNTLDVRGTRIGDLPAKLDALLDRLLGEGESVAFVLHGHGSGALRSAVREHLASSRFVDHVRSAEPDEGGDAFTIFWVQS